MISASAFFLAILSFVLVAGIGTSQAQNAPETCSLDDPIHCSSCRALTNTVSALDGKRVSEGREIDGTVWTPLFTAYFFNCQDLGRELVRRGADVDSGGRNGGLLAEIATQRALNPDPKNSSTNSAWAAIVEVGAVDLDAPVPSGTSNRQIWLSPASPAGERYIDIWTRFERKSISTPVRPDDVEVEADAPTSATGKTRPAESPVSKGVEKFFQTQQKSGMAGLSVEISGCYKWALQIKKPSGRRVALENCAALDIVSRNFDVEFTSRNGFPRTPFFEDSAFEARINQVRDQHFDGMIWPIYRRNLEASAGSWFAFHYELLETSRDASSSSNLTPSAATSNNSRSNTQFKELSSFIGRCRYQIVAGFFDCNPKVAFAELVNGRSVIMFQSGDTTFTLSGGRDRQPNLENYYLGIDHFRLEQKGSAPAEDNNIEGECHFSLSKDGTRFYSIKCDIYNRRRGAAYNFYLENISRFDRKTF